MFRNVNTCAYCFNDFRVLAESLDENIPKDTGLAPTPPDLYDDRAVALNKLANIVLKAERERINRNALTVSTIFSVSNLISLQ